MADPNGAAICCEMPATLAATPRKIRSTIFRRDRRRILGVSAVPLDVQINDIATMRKPHPCGSLQWRVVRLGADIGLRCLKCDHKVLLPRRQFERQVKKLTREPPAPAPE